MADKFESLFPWLLLAGFISIPLAYLCDNMGAGPVSDNIRQARNRAALAVTGAYALLIVGSALTAVFGERGFGLFVLVCFLSFILAIVGILTGARSGGWTRFAAVTSAALLIAALVFTMSRCDL